MTLEEYLEERMLDEGIFDSHNKKRNNKANKVTAEVNKLREIVKHIAVAKNEGFKKQYEAELKKALRTASKEAKQEFNKIKDVLHNRVEKEYENDPLLKRNKNAYKRYK